MPVCVCEHPTVKETNNCHQCVAIWAFLTLIHKKKRRRKEGRIKVWISIEKSTGRKEGPMHNKIMRILMALMQQMKRSWAVIMSSSLTEQSVRVQSVYNSGASGGGGGIVLFRRGIRGLLTPPRRVEEEEEEDRVRSIYLIPSHPIIWLLLRLETALVFIEKHAYKVHHHHHGDGDNPGWAFCTAESTAAAAAYWCWSPLSPCFSSPCPKSIIVSLHSFARDT